MFDNNDIVTPVEKIAVYQACYIFIFDEIVCSLIIYDSHNRNMSVLILILHMDAIWGMKMNGIFVCFSYSSISVAQMEVQVVRKHNSEDLWYAVLFSIGC